MLEEDEGREGVKKYEMIIELFGQHGHISDSLLLSSGLLKCTYVSLIHQHMFDFGILKRSTRSIIRFLVFGISSN